MRNDRVLRQNTFKLGEFESALGAYSSGLSQSLSAPVLYDAMCMARHSITRIVFGDRYTARGSRTICLKIVYELPAVPTPPGELRSKGGGGAKRTTGQNGLVSEYTREWLGFPDFYILLVIYLTVLCHNESEDIQEDI